MTYQVRRNATTDSRAFVAACEAFSSERHPVVRPSIRVQQPSGGVSTVEFGRHDIARETEALMKSRPGSDSRKSEMYRSVSHRTDSGNGENNGAREAGMRIHQEHHKKKKLSWLTGTMSFVIGRGSRPMSSANDLFKLAVRKVHLLDRLITIQAARTSETPLIRSTL